MSSASYRMNAAISAILCEGEKPIAISLPAGSIVTVQLTGEDLPTGLVDAVCDGQHLMVFAVDLRERAARLKVRQARGRS